MIFIFHFKFSLENYKQTIFVLYFKNCLEENLIQASL